MTPEGADLKFGAITVVTGVIGTILGGVALDKVGSTMTNALAICCISNVVGCVSYQMPFECMFLHDLRYASICVFRNFCAPVCCMLFCAYSTPQSHLLPRACHFLSMNLAIYW